MSTPPVRRPDQQPPTTSGLSPAALPGNVFTVVYIVGSSGGLFLYTPTVGPNNLVASGAAVAGTNHGNQVIPGWTAYSFSGGTIQQYASVQAGVIQLGGGPPAGYAEVPTLEVSNGTGNLLINGGQLAGGSSGLPAELFLMTGAIGHNGYVLVPSPSTLLVAAAGPPSTTAAVEIAAANGNGLAMANLAGTPASVAGYSFWYSDAFTQLHTDRAIVTDVDVETKNQGSVPGAGGSGPKWFGESGYGLFVSGQTGIGGDTNTYDTGRLTLFMTGTQTINSTISTSLTGLTKTLGVGTYKISGSITYVSNQTAAANPTIAFSNGGTPTLGYYNSEYTVRTNNVTSTSPVTAFNNTNFDGIATSHTGPAYQNGQFVEFTFRGILTLSAGGAFTAVAKTSAGVDTFTIQAGSYMEIQPVVAT